jgi:hypothetical protein
MGAILLRAPEKKKERSSRPPFRTKWTASAMATSVHTDRRWIAEKPSRSPVSQKDDAAAQAEGQCGHRSRQMQDQRRGFDRGRRADEEHDSQGHGRRTA